jgi:hypothetical protein
MRGDPGSGSRGTRRVAEDRAKILRLIETLAAARQRDGMAHRALGSARPEHDRHATTRELALATRTGAAKEYRVDSGIPRHRRTEPLEPLDKRTELNLRSQGDQARIQNLEMRVARLEERLSRSMRPPVAAAEAQPPPTFSGVIQDQMLSDMLQLVSSNGLSGIFVVEDEQTRSTLYFDEGAICHAEAPGMTGEMAFFTAFGIQNGRYSFRQTTELPSERTVTGSTQFLILEALRQIDENGGNG